MMHEKLLKEKMKDNGHDRESRERRLKELKEIKARTVFGTDAEEIKINDEIAKIETQLGLYGEAKRYIGKLIDGASGETGIIDEQQKKIDGEKTHLLASNDKYKQDVPKEEKLTINSLQDNAERIEQIHALLNDYLETYKEDKETNKWWRGLQFGAFILSSIAFLIGLGCLALAVWGREAPPKKTLALADDGHASTGDTPSEPSDEKVEKLMQDLVINKAVIASGKIPQDLLWKNLASVADSLDLEGQNTGLILIQGAAVDLEGGRDFFWLDISDATERYQALRQAHKKSGKLSDVYLAATKLEYNGKKIPPFHVALLLQLALRLIKHDSMFGENINTNAVGL